VENDSFLKPVFYSAMVHLVLFLFLAFLLSSFLTPKTPLMMELTLIGQMSKGEGLGSVAANPGQQIDQIPQAQTQGTFSTPQKVASNPQVAPQKSNVALHKPLPSQKYSGNASSESYLESLDKSAPIGLSVRKEATNEIKTTAGLGHLGVAGTPEGDAQIEGELAARAVKTKIFPKYPQWAQQQGVEGSVRFRMTVLPNGLLKDDLELEQTSGYPDLDQAVYSALIQWEFTALAPDAPQVNQSGVITFSFNFEKNQ
jgi:TonB family protein